MRKIFYVIAFLLAINNGVFAQAGSNDAAISNILNIMPAQNAAQLNKSMDAITALGETGITYLATWLKEKGDNTAVEYALGGYTYYVIQPGKQAQRAIAVKAYCAALDKVAGPVNKQFIIKQLQQMGTDDAVPALAKYLNNKRLSGDAARALAQINTVSARKQLMDSLLTIGKFNRADDITAALLFSNLPPDNGTNHDYNAAFIKEGAKAAAYTYDTSNSVRYYLSSIRLLYANGNKPLALKLATGLLNDAENKIQTKTAALKLLVDMQGQSSLPALQKAMKDDNAQYRQAALWYAAKYQTPATNKQWLALLPALSPAAQVQVIGFVAQSKDKLALPVFTTLLKDKNAQVRLAAIAAAGKVGNAAALPRLLSIIKAVDTTEINAVRDAILIMKGDVMPALVSAYPTMPQAGKVALLTIIAARQYNSAMPLVVNEFNGTDVTIMMNAGQALPAIAQQKDLPVLFGLLSDGHIAYTPLVQQAIIAATAGISDTAQRRDIIVTAMDKAKADRKHLYLKLLAATGGSASLGIIQSAYDNGKDEITKLSAVEALSASKEAKAARLLLKIAQAGNGQNFFAVDGYIKIIEQSSFPADEKLLMLKEAMALATTDDQRKTILEQVGDCNSLLAVLFAGQYLDNAAVQQEAAHAVMDIALNHREYNGDIVRGLLTKASAILNDKDADYERQAIKKYLDNMPAGEGFVSMFNGKDLAGWKGLVENPIARAKMPADTLKAKQAEADKVMNAGWYVKDGYLVFSGHGENLCTVKQYDDFDMYVDWKIGPQGDAGIYLRGSPQVQIWDTSRRSVGAEVGSGGLYNNAKAQSKPLVLADNAINEWNSFHIIMRDDKVTVYLNGVLVTDNVVLENYWDRKIPIFPKEQIELQAHGNVIYYRDLYIKELTKQDAVALSIAERKDGFTALFDGTNLDQWVGDKSGYRIDNDGSILVDTTAGNPGNMYTKDEYGNFVLRFQFKLTPGANNGIGIRAPLDGDAAYVGMEIQVLDSEHPKYKDLHPYQYHGSVYGVIPAKRGFLKPTGEWNEEEIVATGSHIKVTLNGEVIVDGDIDEASKNGTADHREHPGLKRQTGHIGFLGHGDVVRFKNVRVKTLTP